MSSEPRYAGVDLPAVDEHLLASETRYELHDGVLVYVSPALEAHGSRHSKISAVVEAHAGAEFDVASDMLTRTGETSEIAPDVSVFPSARDPATGGRQLEQVAFEVVSTESLSHAGGKAAKLVARGVRRVFAIDIERARALEWSAELGTWSVLDDAAQIDDPVFATPLAIEALIHAAKADDAMARALIAKRNPLIEAVRSQDRAEGLADGVRRGMAEGTAAGVLRGKAEAIADVLAARGIALEPEQRARIFGERDPARLDRWIACAVRCATAAELLAAP